MKQKPDEWSQILGIMVMDPDGWNRQDYDNDWNKRLTLREFVKKASASTCQYSPLYLRVSEYLRKIK